MADADWTALFPYRPHFFTLPDGEGRLHYVDEGHGDCPVVLLHGNPTWSFMYRTLIAALSEQDHRVLALDHLGFGRSDKPQDASYDLAHHVKRLEAFLDATVWAHGTGKIDLVLHDWGGPIGLLYAIRHPERIRRIVLMNTIAWMTRQFPKAIYLTKCPILGAFLVRRLNLLMRTALYRMPIRRLSPAVEAGYRAPYLTYGNRIGILAFPQDIPLSSDHVSYSVFEELSAGLERLSKTPAQILWGMRDFCFPPEFLAEWRTRLPHAQVVEFPNASHFLLEDTPAQTHEAILRFLKS